MSGVVSSSSSAPRRSARAIRPSSVEHAQRRERGRGRQVVAAERRAVAHGSLHAVEHPLEGRARDEHRADRHEPAGQRLGETDHVGLEPPVLQREEAPGTPDPGLDLIADEQRPRLAAQRLGADQVARPAAG